MQQAVGLIVTGRKKK